MAFVKAGPSFPAMTVAEKPSLFSSFNRFRRFSVQFATMRRFLRPASTIGSHPAGWFARLAQRNHPAGSKLRTTGRKNLSGGTTAQRCAVPHQAKTHVALLRRGRVLNFRD